MQMILNSGKIIVDFADWTIWIVLASCLLVWGRPSKLTTTYVQFNVYINTLSTDCLNI